MDSPWKPFLDTICAFRGSVPHHPHLRATRFYWGNTQVHAHDDCLRSKANLNPNSTQIAPKMLPKCIKKHNKMVQKVSLDITWQKEKRYFFLDAHVPKRSPKGVQMTPRAAQRDPKGSPKGSKSRLFQVPVATRNALRPPEGPHSTI